MIIVGFVIVTIFAYQLSLLDQSAQSSDFFWPIILRALGLSLVTIPLTQLAVSGLHQRDIPQGVALNNMMRQMGGSFGVAFINTYLDHKIQDNRTMLVARIVPGQPATDLRLAQITHMLSSRGMTAWEASRHALALLELSVERQASLLSYLDAFRLVALLSFICVPIILLAGRGKKLTKEAAAAAAESH
jgi:DHA2 family multidrug resistance protein